MSSSVGGYVYYRQIILTGLVSSFTETEKEMVNVERVAQYVSLTPEETTGVPTHLPAATSAPPLSSVLSSGAANLATWPARGTVAFEDLSMAYRGGPLVLRGVTLRAAAGQRVAVVGRTGAGKSSLFQVRRHTAGFILHLDISTPPSHTPSMLTVARRCCGWRRLAADAFSLTVSTFAQSRASCCDHELPSSLRSLHPGPLHTFIYFCQSVCGSIIL